MRQFMFAWRLCVRDQSKLRHRVCQGHHSACRGSFAHGSGAGPHGRASRANAGTMPYMSPELIAHARLTQLNDVYSFGIVMWQLFTGEVRPAHCRWQPSHAESERLSRAEYVCCSSRCVSGWRCVKWSCMLSVVTALPVLPGNLPVSRSHCCAEAVRCRKHVQLDPCMWLRAQSPFANLTLGALFFAVVHEKRRPDLGAFEAAVACGGEHAGLMRQYRALMQRCWSQDPAERPNFLKASALAFWGVPRLFASPGRLPGKFACRFPAS